MDMYPFTGEFVVNGMEGGKAVKVEFDEFKAAINKRGVMWPNFTFKICLSLFPNMNGNFPLCR